MADDPIVTTRDIYQAVTALTGKMSDLTNNVTAVHGQVKNLCRRLDEEAERNKQWRTELEAKIHEVKIQQHTLETKQLALWTAIQNIKVKVYGFTAALSFLGLMVGIMTVFDTPV